MKNKFIVFMSLPYCVTGHTVTGQVVLYLPRTVKVISPESEP